MRRSTSSPSFGLGLGKKSSLSAGLCLFRRWNGNGAYGRACGSPQLKGQADEGKCVALIASQVLQEEVFYDVDPMAHEQDHMTGQGHLELGVDKSNLVPGDIIGPHGPDFSTGKPGGGSGAHSSRLQIYRRVLPERPVTSAQQYDITFVYGDSLVVCRSFELIALDGVPCSYTIYSP